MSWFLNIETPAEKEAGKLASTYGLQQHGLTGLNRVYWNLPTGALYEEAVFRREGRVAHLGPLVVNTGKHTARAAADKFIVQENTTNEDVWWGEYNRPFNPTSFSALVTRMQGYLQGRDVFVQDVFAGADPDHRMPIRIITELAWHSLFVRTMFAKPRGLDAYRKHVPEFTIICASNFKGSPIIDSTRTETFIIADFAERLAVIGGSAYGGEIKKTIFTVLNFLLPFGGVMPMHCSANVGERGDVRCSSAFREPARRRIGRSVPPVDRDDEHGWSDNGIFNFEDGCYAKVIRLSEEAEPQIYNCTRRFGTLLENVTMDPVSHRLDLNDESVTENTRGAYPLTYIDNALDAKMAGHRRTSSS
jgi:phosphoenolpyruvate carboxykinase (ATP)